MVKEVSKQENREKCDDLSMHKTHLVKSRERQ